ncbi:MAG: glycosyltransferase family 2 protein [Candidatus Omnitrophica bacterium]|nr:glycosyltransferase family 2 protein [Candidatus Omnitrophota bacterium]
MDNEVYFTLISPIHNEAPTIEQLVDRGVKALNGSSLLKGKRWEYVLVDDGSTDNTQAIIAKMMSRYPEIVVGVRHKKRMGQGQALVTGFFVGKGSIFGIIDSDLEKLPEDTPKLLKEYIGGACDIVCAYIENKHWISKIGNAVARFIFRHTARQIGANQMIIASKFAHKVNLVCNDQRYVLPIAVSLGARRIGQVKTTYVLRRHGHSKYNMLIKVFQGIPEMLLLKWRITINFYQTRLGDAYADNFDLISRDL